MNAKEFRIGFWEFYAIRFPQDGVTAGRAHPNQYLEAPRGVRVVLALFKDGVGIFLRGKSGRPIIDVQAFREAVVSEIARDVDFDGTFIRTTVGPTYDHPEKWNGMAEWLHHHLEAYRRAATALS